ncbi:hypothetical protein [Naasia lichenicola]|uniref:Plasmid mobilization relaxosome protein MobC n=1 Tax=Naasia lichenicola TaxID=2565933 RepID=A0A4S4FKU2_9MICO|nr:hypothetical protein [Naasia lichenicola]THG31010.1 hypothetical protein E6C64_10440 [Naasia lichenicola]
MKLTEEEDRQLRELADGLNMTVARFLHETSMAPPSTFTADQERAFRELSMLMIPLRNLANFTNAVARLANTEKRLPAEAAEIYPAYMRLSRELHGILKRINTW